jgi:hypothetical protein
MQVYIYKDSQYHGPYSVDQIRDLHAAGKVQTNDLAWDERTAQWVPVGYVLGLYTELLPLAFYAGPEDQTKPKEAPMDVGMLVKMGVAGGLFMFIIFVGPIIASVAYMLFGLYAVLFVLAVVLIFILWRVFGKRAPASTGLDLKS